MGSEGDALTESLDARNATFDQEVENDNCSVDDGGTWKMAHISATSTVSSSPRLPPSCPTDPETQTDMDYLWALQLLEANPDARSPMPRPRLTASRLSLADRRRRYDPKYPEKWRNDLAISDLQDSDILTAELSSNISGTLSNHPPAVSPLRLEPTLVSLPSMLSMEPAEPSMGDAEYTEAPRSQSPASVYHDTEGGEAEIMAGMTVPRIDGSVNIEAPDKPSAPLPTDPAHPQSISQDNTASPTVCQQGSRPSISSTQQQIPPSLGIQPPASELLVDDHTEHSKLGPITRSPSMASQSPRRPRAQPKSQRSPIATRFFAPWRTPKKLK